MPRFFRAAGRKRGIVKVALFKMNMGAYFDLFCVEDGNFSSGDDLYRIPNCGLRPLGNENAWMASLMYHV